MGAAVKSSYELGREALKLWRANNGDESLDQQCIRFDGYYWQWAFQGNEKIQSYDPATSAADNSPMYTSDVNDPGAQPGDLWYWWWGRDGHVGTVLGHDSKGRVLVTHTSSSGDLVEQWSNNVRVSHADTIPHRFRGGSHQYGVNKRREGLAAWPRTTNSHPKWVEKKRRRVAMSNVTVAAAAKDSQGKDTFTAVSFDVNTGEEREFTTGDRSYIQNVGRTYSGVSDYVTSFITPEHFEKIRRENAATRARRAGGIG